MFDLIPFGRRDRDLYRYFDDFDKHFFGNAEKMFAGFRTDIMDKGDHYILQAELPGFAKEDIHIDIDGDYLTISAQHDEVVDDKKDSYIRKERHYGSFSRSFNIADVKADEISAKYRHGVLEMNTQKTAREASTARKIDIE